MTDEEIKQVISDFKAKIPDPPKVIKVNFLKDARPMIVEGIYSLHTDKRLTNKEYKRYKDLWFKEHKSYPSLIGSFGLDNIVSLDDTVSWNIAGYEKLRKENYLISLTKWKEKKKFFKENDINNPDKIEEYRKCVIEAFRELTDKLIAINDVGILVIRSGAERITLSKYLRRGLTTSSLVKGGLTISNKPLYKLARTLVYKYNCQLKADTKKD